MNYRKIWIQHNGPIPKDEEGRSYDIHHIDKDRSNNSIENLMCVSIEEHYNIHFNQGDWNAAALIADRLSISNQERLFINKKISETTTGKPKPWVSDPEKKLECPHCGKLTSVANAKQWHFDNCLKKEGVDPNIRKQSKEVVDRRVAFHRGSTHIMKKSNCEFCDREISLNQKKRHELSCELNPNRVYVPNPDHSRKMIGKNKKPKPTVECPHCKKVGGVPQMIQWHFDNCKHKSK